MLALGYSVLSRLAYVLYIGLALRRADAQPVSRDAAASAYARFRRRAALLMYHDGIAFVAVCVLTRGTLDLPVPPAWRSAWRSSCGRPRRWARTATTGGTSSSLPRPGPRPPLPARTAGCGIRCTP